VCLLSPLGNRRADVEAWNKHHKDSRPKEELTQKEVHERANWRRHYDKKRWWMGVCYLVEAYCLGENPIKSLNEVINGAMKRLGKTYTSSSSMAALREFVREYLERGGINYVGMMVSSRSLQIWWQIINMVGKHYRLGGNRKIDDALNWAIEKVGATLAKNDKTKLKRMLLHMLRQRGIDWEGACLLKTGKFPKPSGRTIEKSRKTLSNITVNRGKGTSSSKRRWGLTGAIMEGRKPRFGFGRYWSRNDEDWITLESLHYDNCKVAFRPKLLARTIYNLLNWGAQKEDIICQYDILLHDYHRLAVDTETAVWEPTKLVNDLRKRVFEKLGL